MARRTDGFCKTEELYERYNWLKNENRLIFSANEVVDPAYKPILEV